MRHPTELVGRDLVRGGYIFIFLKVSIGNRSSRDVQTRDIEAPVAAGLFKMLGRLCHAVAVYGVVLRATDTLHGSFLLVDGSHLALRRHDRHMPRVLLQVVLCRQERGARRGEGHHRLVRQRTHNSRDASVRPVPYKGYRRAVVLRLQLLHGADQRPEHVLRLLVAVERTLRGGERRNPAAREGNVKEVEHGDEGRERLERKRVAPDVHVASQLASVEVAAHHKHDVRCGRVAVAGDDHAVHRAVLADLLAVRTVVERAMDAVVAPLRQHARHGGVRLVRRVVRELGKDGHVCDAQPAEAHRAHRVRQSCGRVEDRVRLRSRRSKVDCLSTVQKAAAAVCGFLEATRKADDGTAAHENEQHEPNHHRHRHGLLHLPQRMLVALRVRRPVVRRVVCEVRVRVRLVQVLVGPGAAREVADGETQAFQGDGVLARLVPLRRNLFDGAVRQRRHLVLRQQPPAVLLHSVRVRVRARVCVVVVDADLDAAVALRRTLRCALRSLLLLLVLPAQLGAHQRVHGLDVDVLGCPHPVRHGEALRHDNQEEEEQRRRVVQLHVSDDAHDHKQKDQRDDDEERRLLVLHVAHDLTDDEEAEQRGERDAAPRGRLCVRPECHPEHDDDGRQRAEEGNRVLADRGLVHAPLRQDGRVRAEADALRPLELAPLVVRTVLAADAQRPRVCEEDGMHGDAVAQAPLDKVGNGEEDVLPLDRRADHGVEQRDHRGEEDHPCQVPLPAQVPGGGQAKHGEAHVRRQHSGEVQGDGVARALRVQRVHDGGEAGAVLLCVDALLPQLREVDVAEEDGVVEEHPLRQRLRNGGEERREHVDARPQHAHQPQLGEEAAVRHRHGREELPQQLVLEVDGVHQPVHGSQQQDHAVVHAEGHREPDVSRHALDESALPVAVVVLRDLCVGLEPELARHLRGARGSRRLRDGVFGGKRGLRLRAHLRVDVAAGAALPACQALAALRLSVRLLRQRVADVAARLRVEQLRRLLLVVVEVVRQLRELERLRVVRLQHVVQLRPPPPEIVRRQQLRRLVLALRPVPRRDAQEELAEEGVQLLPVALLLLNQLRTRLDHVDDGTQLSECLRRMRVVLLHRGQHLILGAEVRVADLVRLADSVCVDGLEEGAQARHDLVLRLYLVRDVHLPLGVEEVLQHRFRGLDLVHALRHVVCAQHLAEQLLVLLVAEHQVLIADGGRHRGGGGGW
eukprot:Rhum_TRINITY_DN3519_c0_g1::Rhum_TRINITY_DN3519_c0_g1_i1::g.11164::m.11164